jgi:hypothetical protein
MLTRTLEQAAGGQAWAIGCAHCRHGMIDAPEVSVLSANPTYLQRAIQAAQHDIQFCTCKAGVQMRAYLLRVWQGELKGRELDDEIPVPTVRYIPATIGLPVSVGGAAYALQEGKQSA